MKRVILLLLAIITLFSSCTSFQMNSDYYSSSIESNNGASDNKSSETPYEFYLRKKDEMQSVTWSNHQGTLRDPIPIGQYAEWSIYNVNRILDERTDYIVSMNVNYSVRGDKALNLYNTYSKELINNKTAYSSYNKYDYEGYIPKNGNELIIINITLEVESDKNKPLSLNPFNFNLASSNGVKIPGGRNEWDYFKYYKLVDYEVYPGGKAEGYLVYEVPKDEDIYLEFVGVWFRVE